MKILVAGGLGFIGSKVIEKLCDEHSVTAFDSKETYDVLTKEDFTLTDNQIKNL